MKLFALGFVVFGCSLLIAPAHAIEITIDYRYDSNNFFDESTTEGQQARAALRAVADRYSRIIENSTLTAITVVDDPFDQRIGFTHPGTGEYHEISAAESELTDRLVEAGAPPAHEYWGEISLDEDEWLLFAGGHQLEGFGAIGGTSGGVNFTVNFQDPNAITNRGFRPMGGDVNSLPVWGGSIAVDTEFDWHFDHLTAPVPGKPDLYSTMLHEVGHAFGMSSGWTEFSALVEEDRFLGENAIAAYNKDNGTDVDHLLMQAPGEFHWLDGTYTSKIFSAGGPNLLGTAGLDGQQKLLMDPTLRFRESPRIELTNVDVGSLEDVGWPVIESTSCDLDGDIDCDIDDLDQLIQEVVAGNATLIDRDEWLSEAASAQGFLEPFLVGDANLDGAVDRVDLNVVGVNWLEASGTWSKGDFDGSGDTVNRDLNSIGVNWQKRIPIAASASASASAAVPEPSSIVLLILGLAIFRCQRSAKQSVRS